MKHLKYIFLILPAFLFASCEDVIEFDTAISESQLVLNGVPSCEKQLTLFFGYSRFFLQESNDNPFPGAEVVVSVNGHDYYPDSVRRCSYYFPYTLQDDDSVSVRINAGGNIVTAHTHVPRMPKISTPLAWIDTTQVFDLLMTNFDISDHPNYKEYYCVTIQQRDSGSRYNEYFQQFDTIDTIYNTYFVCFDKDLTASDAAASIALGGYFYDKLLTTDKHIDGQDFNTTLMVMLLKDTNEIYPFIHQYTLQFESVTPDRYRYLQDLTNATSLTQYFTEPAPVYSNVEGALGIFAGNARRTFPLYTITNGKDPSLFHSKGKGSNSQSPQRNRKQK